MAKKYSWSDLSRAALNVREVLGPLLEAMEAGNDKSYAELLPVFSKRFDEFMPVAVSIGSNLAQRIPSLSHEEVLVGASLDLLIQISCHFDTGMMQVWLFSLASVGCLSGDLAKREADAN